MECVSHGPADPFPWGVSQGLAPLFPRSHGGPVADSGTLELPGPAAGLSVLGHVLALLPAGVLGRPRGPAQGRHRWTYGNQDEVVERRSRLDRSPDDRPTSSTTTVCGWLETGRMGRSGRA